MLQVRNGFLIGASDPHATKPGNTAYDALIARCAIKAEAAVPLTWNVRTSCGWVRMLPA
jgi:hypothetical protein